MWKHRKKTYFFFGFLTNKILSFGYFSHTNVFFVFLNSSWKFLINVLINYLLTIGVFFCFLTTRTGQIVPRGKGSATTCYYSSSRSIAKKKWNVRVFFLLKIIFMDIASARLSDINNNRGEICVYRHILFAYGRIYPGQQMAVIRSSRIKFDAVSC